jgi:hypothetical protein
MTVQSAATTMIPPTMEPRIIHVLGEKAEAVVAGSEGVGVPESVAVTRTTLPVFLMVGDPVFTVAGGGVVWEGAVEGVETPVEVLEVLLVDFVSVTGVFVGVLVLVLDVFEVLVGSAVFVSAGLPVSLALPVGVPVPVPVPVFSPPPPRIGIPPCLLIFLTILSEPTKLGCRRTIGCIFERPLAAVGPVERAAKRATRMKAVLAYLTISAARRNNRYCFRDQR